MTVCVDFLLRSARKNLVCREKPSQTSHFLSSVVVAGGEAASWLRAHLSLSHTLLHTFYFLPLSLSFWILSPPLPLCFSSLCVFLSHTHSLSLSLPLSSWPPSCSFIINSSRSLQSLLFLGFTWPRHPCCSSHPPAPLRLRRSRTQELLSTFTAFCVNGLLHGNT